MDFMVGSRLRRLVGNNMAWRCLAWLGEARRGVARQHKARFILFLENKMIKEMNAESRLLIEFLRKAEPGETITYEAMKDFIERDPQGSARGSLDTARRNLIKEGILFQTISKVGVRRMTSPEIANGQGTKTIAEVHRKMRRDLKKLRCAAVEELKNDELIRMNTDASVLGMMHECTKVRKIHLLEAVVRENNSDELAIGQTLAQFQK